MRKLILAIAAVAVMAFAGPAFADHDPALVAVEDPTPDNSFSGAYVIANDDPATPEDESATGTQNGYVGVYGDGVVACNGNPGLTRPDDGSPLVGYIFVGDPSSNNVPDNTSGGGAAGPVAVGNNHETADDPATPEDETAPTGHSPCPESDPTSVNEG